MHGMTGQDVAAPDVIVFDVNETLSDMAPMGRAFVAEGLPEHVARTWFSEALRDGFAVTAAGGAAPFAEIARDGLVRLGEQARLEAPETAAERLMGTFKDLDVHPDVVAGVRALAPSAELVTLSNGTARVAERLLERAGLRESFSRLLSVEDAPAWKPARSAYEHAVARCGADPGRMMLVAVHPWDVHGAHRAGLRTAWIDREGSRYPGHFAAPDLRAPDLPSLAEQLAHLSG
ncbi:haloacid dehalogenase type II [Nesterenkonia sp. F]|uniref:haloacid dehalogenase type II n=1 Tax=Nesterenkonia sp. F TaxID=795955 RepID=UPI0011125B33|nr:haloacid dehalogenase type II [Nesterenkonia sp. F]